MEPIYFSSLHRSLTGERVKFDIFYLITDGTSLYFRGKRIIDPYLCLYLGRKFVGLYNTKKIAENLKEFLNEVKKYETQAQAIRDSIVQTGAIVQVFENGRPFNLYEKIKQLADQLFS